MAMKNSAEEILRGVAQFGGNEPERRRCGSSEGAVGAATGELRKKLSKATCVANGKLRSSAPKKLKVNISP